MKMGELSLIYSVSGHIYILMAFYLQVTIYTILLSVYLYGKTLDCSEKMWSREKKEWAQEINRKILLPFILGTIVAFSINWIPYLFYLTALFGLWFPFQDKEVEEIVYSFSYFYLYFIMFAPLLSFPFLTI